MDALALFNVAFKKCVAIIKFTDEAKLDVTTGTDKTKISDGR